MHLLLFQQHKRSNCTILWKYKGRKVAGCSHEPTPSHNDKNCRNFRRKSGFEWPSDVDEIALVDNGARELITTCYRRHPGRYKT